MLRKSLLENAFDAKYVQNDYFEGKCSGNHNFKMLFDTTYVQNHVTLKANTKADRYFKMHLTPTMYKNIPLKANVKEIITLKCV